MEQVTAPSSQGMGRYGFAGRGMDLFGVRLVGGFLTSATCGIAWILGVPRSMELRWVAEHVTRDGQRFEYRSIFWDNVKNAVVTWLLLAVTLGLAYPWVIAMRLAHERSKMHTAEGHPLRFDGKGVEVIGLCALTLFGAIFSLGLAIPWLSVAWHRWIAAHTLVHDPSAPGGTYRLRLEATGIDYLVVAAVNAILIVLTLGFGSSWAAVRRAHWLWSSTTDELAHAASASGAGARAPAPRASGPSGAQWALVAGAALVVLVALGAAGVGGTMLAFRYFGRGDESIASPIGELARPAHDPVSDAVHDRDEDAHRSDDDDPAILGEEPMVSITPASTAASSVLPSRTGAYVTARAFDGDRRTAWAEGAEGPGRGEWIEARLSDTRIVRRVRLTTGYDKIHERSGDLFYLNAHLRRVRLRFSDGTERVRDVGHDEREVVFDDLRVSTRSVRIIADEVWEGTRWEDLSLSEIWIEGD